MTLDDVIEAGKKEGMLKELEAKYSQDPSMNLAAQTAIIEDPRVAEQEEVIRRSANFTPSAHKQVWQGAYITAQGNLITKVQDSYRACMDKLVEGENGLVYASSILTKIKPNESVNSPCFESHNKLYKWTELDPQSQFNQVLSEYKSTAFGLIVQLLLASDSDIPKVVINGRTRELQNEFVKSLQNAGNARTYLDKLYNASDDEAKKGIAYELGAIVTRRTLQE